MTEAVRIDHASLLAAMSDDARTRSRIAAAVLSVRAATLAAGSRKEAVGNGQDNRSLTMRIRKFHDEFGQMAGRGCPGAIYRSAGALAPGEDGGPNGRPVRCEHVVPASILAGIVWDRFRDRPVEDLARFLMRRTVVAAILRSEDATNLVVRRSYDGGTAKSWKALHPEYGEGKDPLDDRIRPFRRYDGTGIEIFSMTTGGRIVLADHTMADHERMLEGLSLYDPTTYDFAIEAERRTTMRSAHAIVADYKRDNGIVEDDFQEWFRDGGYPQDYANIHDSRHLELLRSFVEERDADRAM